MRSTLDKAQLRRISEATIGHYNRAAEDFCDGTRDQDVSQKYRALLDAIEGEPPFFHTLKVELVHQCRWATHGKARQALFGYIEGYYNRHRMHSALG